MMNMIARFHEKRSRTIPTALSKDDDKKYRIAYFNEALDHPSLDPEISASIKRTIERIKSRWSRGEPRPV